MKTSLLTIVAAILFVTSVTAQNYEYVPMVREGVKWVYVTLPEKRYPADFYPVDKKYDYTTVTYEIKGDTLIRDLVFKKCWRTIDTPYDNYYYTAEPQVVAYLYEADKRVWATFPTDFAANISNLMGYQPYTNEQMMIMSNISPQMLNIYGIRLLYDFNDVESFLKDIPRKYYPAIDALDPYFKVVKTDYVEVNGVMRQRYHLEAEPSNANSYGSREDEHHMARVYHTAFIVESYGFIPGVTGNQGEIGTRETYSFLSPTGEYDLSDNYTPFTFQTIFSHVEENGQVAFKGPKYSTAQELLKKNSVGIDEMKFDTDGNEDDYYDLQGRPVTGTPAPGIYIHQGKKVVVAE